MHADKLNCFHTQINHKRLEL